MSLPLTKKPLMREPQVEVPGDGLQRTDDLVIWRNPLGREGTLILMTLERLIFADPGDAAEIDLAIACFRRDGTAPTACREISPRAIFRIRFDKRATDIAIFYATDDGECYIHYHDFLDSEVRDGFVAAFIDRFGASFADHTREETPATAALRPLLVASIIGAFTSALHAAADPIAAVGGRALPPRGIEATLTWLAGVTGPDGALLLGVCSLALTATALIRRVARRPTLRTLARRPRHPR